MQQVCTKGQLVATDHTLSRDKPQAPGAPNPIPVGQPGRAGSVLKQVEEVGGQGMVNTEASLVKLRVPHHEQDNPLLPCFLSFKDIYAKRSIRNMPHSYQWSLSWRWEFTLKFYLYLLTSTLFYKRYE